MKKVITINQLLSAILFINFCTIAIAMMERRDMPFQSLEHGKISKEENERKISYIHHAPPFQHVVEYNKETGQYSGYTHHIKSGRTKRTENPSERYQIYEASYRQN